MKKLRIVLQSKLFLFLLFCLVVINGCFVYLKKDHLTYLGSKEVIGVIDKLHLREDRLELEVQADGRFLVSVNIKELLEEYALGDTVKFKANFSIPKQNTNQNTFNYKKYLQSKNIYVVGSILSIQKVRNTSNFFYILKNKIIERIKRSKFSSYYYVFLLGDSYYLDYKVKEGFRINGISHLFAISSMHISILTMIMMYVFDYIFYKRRGNYYLTLFFLFIYICLLGDNPSAYRSFLFYLFYVVQKLYKIEMKDTHVYLISAFLLLLYNPYYIYSVGFLFSFIITYFLLLSKSFLLEKKSSFLKMIWISFISFLASLPISIYYFHEVNVVSIVINIIFIPFISLLFFPVLLLSFCLPTIEIILGILIYILESVSSFCVQFDLSLSFTMVPYFIGIFYYILLVYTLKRKFRKERFLLYLLILIWYTIPSFRTDPVLTMIDVNQGDCFLLEYKRTTILIDTGGYFNSKGSLAKNVIIPYIKSRGHRHIDCLILTHGDIDHIGESFFIIDSILVKQVITNKAVDNSLEKQLYTLLKQKKIPHLKVSKGEILIKNFKLSFLNQKNFKSENKDSLILYTQIKNHNILFMGDADEENEKYINYVYNLPKMDILKVGHHGSKTSSKSFFIQKIRPYYSLISVGRENQYGHPNKETLETLSSIGSNIYMTSQNGMVQFILRKKIKVVPTLVR